MKTEEDEAFDDIARKQGAWGGGFTAKRAMAADKLQEPVKLWLWKNFVDGKPEYWAFDNPFPIFMDSHDPQTLGEPCGYAWLKPSRVGRTDVSDEQVLQDVQKALPVQEPVAWQWLGSAHFRKKIPKNADVSAWNPLYANPPKGNT